MTKKRLVFLTAMGSGLEYYDFVIYALAVQYISHTFFPAGSQWAGVLESLLIFATGYLVRPIGGLIFGSIGDRFGRKKSFTAAIFLMGMATLGIALLPGFKSLGMLSPVLLTCFRCLQGVSQGAELSGAYTFIYEHADDKNKAFLISLVSSGVGLGSLLGSFVFFALHHFYSEQQILDFAWRIAFFIGAGIAFFSFLIRRYALESPAFLVQALPVDHQPVKTLLREHKRPLILGVGLTLFPASFIIYFLFLPSIFAKFYSYNSGTVYFMSTVGFLWSALLLPLFGRLADRIKPRRQLFFNCLLATILLPPLFYLPNLGSAIGLVLFSLLYQTIVAAGSSCYGPLLSGAFPVSVRYSGTALSYNLAFAVAGFMPLLIVSLLSTFHLPLLGAFVLAGLALVSALSTWLYRF